MSAGRPRVPGLNEDWADRQLDLLTALQEAMDTLAAGPYRPSAPVCTSCTLAMTKDAQVGQPWECDPDRPGCPLHQVPEQSR